MGGRERPGGPTEGAGSLPTGWAPARHGGRQPVTVGASPSRWAPARQGGRHPFRVGPDARRRRSEERRVGKESEREWTGEERQRREVIVSESQRDGKEQGRRNVA